MTYKLISASLLPAPGEATQAGNVELVFAVSNYRGGETGETGRILRLVMVRGPELTDCCNQDVNILSKVLPGAI